MTCAVPPVLDHSVPRTQFREQVWRAHHAVGAFQLIGHGLPNRVVFRAFQGSLPQQAEVGGDGDASHKTSCLLAGARHSSGLLPDLTLPAFAAVEAYFQRLLLLADSLLEDFAAIQEVRTGGCRWRGLYGDGERFVALRGLAYYPAGGELRVTTAQPHTDATWITLLQQDDVGGLQVRSREGDWLDVPPIEDALVVNTGNVLASHSAGLFPAVCHRVIRVSSVRTRASMALFYDRNGSSTRGC